MKNIFSCLFLTLVFVSCKQKDTAITSPTENKTTQIAEAEKTVNLFYQCIDNKDYGCATALFGTSFYKVATKEDLIKLFQRLNLEGGEFKSFKIIKWEKSAGKQDLGADNQFRFECEAIYMTKKYTERFLIFQKGEQFKIEGFKIF
ncbi:hypothetical protein [Flavobacterium sp. 3HN19-14]|uniref:hypothetical protein n=1 Tax=Flavobacterium sp. 3HN19-14 TaxID=3448133 RepID=UPI003EE3D760